jgi:hypothetical protein
VNDEPPFGSLQFTVLEVENTLLELDDTKGPGPDGVPPLILKNFASGFALPLCMLFNRSLATCIFPDRWKISFVTPIFKSGRRNDISNCRLLPSYSNCWCIGSCTSILKGEGTFNMALIRVGQLSLICSNIPLLF